ncbi:DUF72 domain-containing protein [Actinosynnema sp. NPDC020468]|uniref:DUF72 domain-containing protein n=1 Tax=Actinosynnema sp. NPDC020468 TaxID=3154488 RepID=UPI0034042C1B
MGEIRIGTSGWHHPGWRGDFYPRGLQQRLELEFLSRRLTTIELNSPFHGLRSPADYASWRDRTPEGFVFAVKGHREVTHTRRLRDAAETVAEFFDSGVRELGPKLGPVLWQFPPSLPFHRDRVTAFLDALPPLRHAVEPRHPGFADESFVDLVRDRNIALVLPSSGGRWPEPDRPTADFGYVRLHGDRELYRSHYDDVALTRWAGRIRELAADGDVFAYFDNTMDGAAPHDAVALADRLTPTAEPGPGGSRSTSRARR